MTFSDKNPHVSAIVITYNSIQEIQSCLDAVRTPFSNKIELIVIDNVSQDGTQKLLKEKYENTEGVTVIYNDTNVGFAVGCNQGALLAKGEYVLLLNPDTVASAASILEMAQYLDTHQDVGVVGPRIVDEYGVAQESYGAELTPWNEFVGKVLYSKYFEKVPFVKKWKHAQLSTHAVQDVGWIGGACMMIRKDLYLKLGGINTVFFLSYGDMLDFCKRVQIEGYRVVLYPVVQIVHTGSKSVASNRDESLRASYIGTLFYFKKYHARSTIFFVTVVYVSTSLVKALIAFPVSLFKKDPYRSIANAHFKNAFRILMGTLEKK